MSHKDLEGMSGLCLIGNLEVTEEGRIMSH
jgi:hypothetical protein